MIDSLDFIIRRRILFAIIVGFAFIVGFKLFRLQIIDSSAFEEKSKENSIRKVTIDAPRGILLDRNGEVLVSNKPSYDIQIIPYEYDRELDRTLEKRLDLDSGYIATVLKNFRMYSKYAPRLIKRDVPFEVISWLEENAEKLPGVRYKVGLQRDYSFGVNGSHIFGYVSEVSAEQLRKNRDKYSIGDIVGKSGLEKTYEDYLRGKKGYRLVVVDARGKPIRNYKNGAKDKAPVKGNDLILTLDKKTQHRAEELFKDKRGALVAMNPNTGEIIAFLSAPQYDLSVFGRVTSGRLLKELNEDEAKPLFNRAIMSMYSPGSTYKMLVALAFLDNNVVTTNNYITCKGGLEIGGRFFGCTHVHGRVNVIEAIEKSCNTFFYNYIFDLGLDKFEQYSHKFGFGSKTGVDIPGEVRGIIPSKKYYDRVYGKRNWNRGQLISISIGQGEVSTTTIQLAQYASLLANSGVTVKPHFVRAVRNAENNETEYLKYDSIKVEGIKKKNLEIIRKGMYLVVNGDGTAQNIRMKNLKIAGKTGTVQNVHGEDHALFIAFAPYENPEIAVAVLVENVGYGSTYAAPIAQDIIKTYLGIKIQKVEEVETNRENQE